jgi:hypothetical protein
LIFWTPLVQKSCHFVCTPLNSRSKEQDIWVACLITYLGISLPSFWMHPGGGGGPWVNQLYPKILCSSNLLYHWELINVHLVVFSKVIYLWSKVVSFVLFVTLSSPKPWPFMSCSWYLWKALSMNKVAWRFMSCSWYLWKALSMNRGAMTWSETVWSYDVKAIDYFIIFSQWKLNKIEAENCVLEFGSVLGVVGKPLAS